MAGKRKMKKRGLKARKRVRAAKSAAGRKSSRAEKDKKKI